MYLPHGSAPDRDGGCTGSPADVAVRAYANALRHTLAMAAATDRAELTTRTSWRPGRSRTPRSPR
ncbi:hypothetical protein ACFQX7_19315 [Luedemannella flava]